MALHYGKLQALGVNTSLSIPTPAGGCVDLQAAFLYLGTMLHSDGCVSGELCRRLGMAKGDFSALSKVWKHSNLSVRRKLEVFSALVEAKLLYSLVATCPRKADLRRLDGFQCRCLRQILRIPPAFVSRVSNKVILEKAGARPFSKKFSQRQLLMLGRIVRAPADNPLQKVSFIPGTLWSAANRYVRRVARPRKEWIASVLAEAYQVTGGTDLRDAVNNERPWRNAVLTHG